MSSRSSTIVLSDDDDTFTVVLPDDEEDDDTFIFVTVYVGGEIHTLHNSYRRMSRDIRPFRNWMRCLDMNRAGETYETTFDEIVECVRNPPDDIVGVSSVIETTDTIRNSRNRSNIACIKETFGAFERKHPRLKECHYSLGRLLESSDGEVIYGAITHIANDEYRFEISYLSFGGIVKRRTLSGNLKTTHTERYEGCVEY